MSSNFDYCDEHSGESGECVEAYSVDQTLGLFQVQIAEILSFTALMAQRTGLRLSEIAALEHLLQARASGSEGVENTEDDAEVEDEYAGLTPTQLGERMSMSSGTITALVKRLERYGYVGRRRNPEDLRSSVVFARPKGLEHAARHMRPLGEDLLQKMAELSDKERAAVGKYLERVTEIISQHARWIT